MDDFGRNLNTRTRPTDIARHLSEEDSREFYDAIDKADNKTLDRLTLKSLNSMDAKEKNLVKEGLEELDAFNQIQQERAKTTKEIHRFVSFSELDSYLNTGKLGRSSFETGENSNYKSFTFDPRNPYFRERDVLLSIPIDDDLRKDLHPVKYSAFPRSDVEKDDTIDTEKTSGFAHETEVRLPADTKVPKNLKINVMTHNIPNLTYGNALKSSEAKKIKDKYSSLGDVIFEGYDNNNTKMSSLQYSGCLQCMSEDFKKKKQKSAAIETIEFEIPTQEDAIKWWKGLKNISKMQHADDPNRLNDAESLSFVQRTYDGYKLSEYDKKRIYLDYAFRHQEADTTKLLGFNIHDDVKIWYNTWKVSQRQHMYDPHQMYVDSLEMCQSRYENLKPEWKKVWDKLFVDKHEEEKPQSVSASGDDLEDIEKIKQKELEKINKIHDTAHSEISKATRLASEGFLAQDDLKQGARTYSPEELGYVESSTPKQCGTCEYFKKPNICTFPMSITVKPVKGCCNKWEEKKKEKIATLTASLESISSCGQYATYFLLAGDEVNGRGWGVTAESIPKNIGDFKGKPFVVTTSDWIKDSPYGNIWNHPSTEHWPILGIARAGTYDVNDKKLIFKFQDKFRTGVITDVFEKDGTWRAIVKKDPAFKDMPWPPFCSPAIYKENYMELDGSLSEWTALHLAGLDAKPAYGNIAILHGTCNGDGTTCGNHLKSASNVSIHFVRTLTAHKINMTLSKWRISGLDSFSTKNTDILAVLKNTDLIKKSKKITPFSEILKNTI